MGICWYCTWGWPKQVAEIYDKYANLVSDDSAVLKYGPGHIVWADENFENDHIEWCINNADEWRQHKWDVEWPDNMRHRGLLLDDEDFRLAVASLKELLEVPEEIRCCQPKEYDDENPRNFPPPATIEMVPRR